MGTGQSADKRVRFDFEVEFSNGGGIQGQDFRLDIAGEDIRDEALAEYVVRDMRLLMVGEVRILNKEIIEEPHKRVASSVTGDRGSGLIAVGATTRRPDFVGRHEDLEGPDEPSYEGSDERFGVDAPLGRALGLTRLGVHHVRLPPGRRSSLPHAQSEEEEFVYVLEGAPDAWIDGHAHRLRPGDAVAFPAGTGIAHTFINDTGSEVRLLVVGEGRNRPDDRVVYPLNPERRNEIGSLWWDEAPARSPGSHAGRPAPQSGAEQEA